MNLSRLRGSSARRIEAVEGFAEALARIRSAPVAEIPDLRETLIHLAPRVAEAAASRPSSSSAEEAFSREALVAVAERIRSPASDGSEAAYVVMLKRLADELRSYRASRIKRIYNPLTWFDSVLRMLGLLPIYLLARLSGRSMSDISTKERLRVTGVVVGTFLTAVLARLLSAFL